MKQKNYSIQVRNITFGSGIPKICVPIVGITKEEILEQVKKAAESGCDFLEWRMDWYEEIWKKEKQLDILKNIREVIKEMPLLATFRTKSEGGQKESRFLEYEEINRNAVLSGYIDLVDIEAFSFQEDIRNLIKEIHDQKCFVIASNHDFQKTPAKEELLNRLVQMQKLETDIIKIAVMPQEKKDVMTLLEVTQEMTEKYARKPVITISMDRMGCISRICGELTGSAVTFASIGSSSAPGQLKIEELKKTLEFIHKNSE